MLPDTGTVETVLFGESGLQSRLKAGHIIVDCSTTHPDFTRAWPHEFWVISAFISWMRPAPG